MRLSLKFTLSFLVGMGMVLAVFAYLRTEREIELFETDLRRDHEAMGRDLAAAVVRIWDLAGEEPALAFVEETNVTKSQVLIRWIPRDKAAPVESSAVMRPETLRELASRNEVLSQPVEIGGRPCTRTLVPVNNQSHWLGTIELAESTEAAAEYIRSSLIRTGVTTSIIVLLTGLLAVVLGIWFVGRPVRMLVLRARQIASGDFSGQLILGQSDELGDLAREVNAMSTHLADANRRIALETTARIQAIEQLRHADRLRTVGQLTSGIAHELGTPLNVVWARAKMIANGEVSGSEVNENAAIIVDQSARITKIIRHLLDFARPRTPTKTRLDLRQVVEHTLHLLEPTARKQGVVLVSEAPEPVLVEADADQIQQVISNLLVNAVQAMHVAGPVSVRLGIRRMRPPAEIGDQEVEYAAISVQDAGEGIPPEIIGRVFEPFFTTKEVGEGTGLGLAVAAGMIKEHGGWIDVKSRVNDGSCFTVYLPRT